MIRKRPNWIALGFALLYLLCLIFLPIYSLKIDTQPSFSISGATLMLFGYALIYLPLALALVMAVASIVLDPKVSIGVAAVTAVVNLVMMLTGKGILTTGAEFSTLVWNLMSFSTNTGSYLITVGTGIGSILCIIVAIGFIVIEVLFGQRRSKPAPVPPVWEDTNSNPLGW